MSRRSPCPRPASARPRAAAALLTVIALCSSAPLGAAPDAAAAAPPTLGQAMQAVVEAGLARIATLETQAKSAAGDQQALAAQAAIIAAKEQMQRELFAVQLDYARRAGNAKLAAELEAALARLDAPAPAVPQEHPAPTSMAIAPEVR